MKKTKLELLPTNTVMSSKYIKLTIFTSKIMKNLHC